jgi:hypothetical protein
MKNLSITIFAFIAVTLTASNCNAQQNNSSSQVSTIEVIQFHSEHRCMTCLKIEKLTRSTLDNYFKTIPFKLVNVDDKNNTKMAEQFEATGTALFLYNPKTGKKKELTDFAFMKAGDQMRFESELKKYIEDFLKS